jgi:16S rRNA (guanine527-N7)-methyltransferase
MPMESFSVPATSSRLADYADLLGLNSEQMNKLETYSSITLRWNERIQLTATRDPHEFVDRHVIDALELARELPNHDERMIDVGSGGGLPGLVLAIARPALQLTLIEPTHKKHAFLKTARRELNLSNVQCFCLRDENLRASAEFEPYDRAVARAVWAVDEWLLRGQALLRPGGWLYALEGRERSELPAGASRREYELPGHRSRAIISWCLPSEESES